MEVQDRELIKQQQKLNRLLQRDPNAELPDYFTKVEVEELVETKQLSEQIKRHAANHALCVEVLGDLLEKGLGVSLFSGRAQTQKFHKAKQIKKRKQKALMEVNSNPNIEKSSPTQDPDGDNSRNLEPREGNQAAKQSSKVRAGDKAGH